MVQPIGRTVKLRKTIYTKKFSQDIRVCKFREGVNYASKKCKLRNRGKCMLIGRSCDGKFRRHALNTTRCDSADGYDASPPFC